MWVCARIRSRTHLAKFRMVVGRNACPGDFIVIRKDIQQPRLYYYYDCKRNDLFMADEFSGQENPDYFTPIMHALRLARAHANMRRLRQ